MREAPKYPGYSQGVPAASYGADTGKTMGDSGYGNSIDGSTGYSKGDKYHDPAGYASAGAISSPTDIFAAMRTLSPEAQARVMRGPEFDGVSYIGTLADTAERGAYTFDGEPLMDLFAAWMLARVPADAPAWPVLAESVRNEHQTA